MEDWHTYFVSGAEGTTGEAPAVLVHNMSGRVRKLAKRLSAGAKAKRLAKIGRRAAAREARIRELGADPAHAGVVNRVEGMVGERIERTAATRGRLRRNLDKDGPEWFDEANTSFDEFLGTMPADRFGRQFASGNIRRALEAHMRKANVTLVNAGHLAQDDLRLLQGLVDQLNATPPDRAIGTLRIWLR